MCVPVILLGQCLVNAVVEVFVVGENDVSANIVELITGQRVVARSTWCYMGHTKPSGVTSVDAKPPGVSLESMIIHDGPPCALNELCERIVAALDAHQLIETLRSS